MDVQGHGVTASRARTGWTVGLLAAGLVSALPLAAQVASDAHVAVRSHPSATASALPDSRPLALQRADSLPTWPRYRAYAAWGAGLGTAVGLVVGVVLYQQSECADCMIPAEASLVVLPAAGALTGLLTGSLMYLSKRSDVAAARRRAGEAPAP